MQSGFTNTPNLPNLFYWCYELQLEGKTMKGPTLNIYRCFDPLKTLLGSRAQAITDMFTKLLWITLFVNSKKMIGMKEKKI